MKIAYILESFPPAVGGAETLFDQIVSGIAARGHQVQVATYASLPTQNPRPDQNPHIRYFQWKRFSNHAVPRLSDINTLVKWADVVHTATYTAAPMALLSAKLHHKPIVLTVYEVLGSRWWQVVSNNFFAFVYFCFEQFIVHLPFSQYHVISNATASDLLAAGIDKKLVKVVYPGVTQLPYRELQPTTRDKEFLFFGRPAKIKGSMLLLEAIEHYFKQFPTGEARFRLILGNEPKQERAAINERVRMMGLASKLVISDSLPYAQLQQAIENAYCVIIPSLTEGFGFSAVEACAKGKPVLISSAGSLPEVAFGKVLQFHTGDVQSLVAAIVKAEAGEFEKIPKRTFNWETTISETIKLYEKLL